MREKQIIKACYIRRGDVIRFDPFGVLKRQPRDEVYNPASSDAYDLRIANIRLIGVCDFTTGSLFNLYRITHEVDDQSKNGYGRKLTSIKKLKTIISFEEE